MHKRRGAVKSAFVSIDLTQEPGRGTFQGDMAARLAELRASLSHLHLRQIAHGKRLIVIVEGWEATGKRALLRQMLASFDPCSTRTYCSDVRPITRSRRHWLAEYWSELPAAGHNSLFYRSWYRRLVDERIERAMSEKHWSRGCDEINEFEAQQNDHDTMIVKLFLHCSAEMQARRVRERRADPWQRVLLDEPDVERTDHVDAWNAVFAETDTRWAPWTLIDAENSAAGMVAAMDHLVKTLDETLPNEAPRDEEGEGAEIVDLVSISR